MLRISIRLTGILLIIGSLFFAQQLFFPTIFADPLVKKILTAEPEQAWGTRFSLIPDQFEAGLPREQFLARLKKAGFAAPRKGTRPFVISTEEMPGVEIFARRYDFIPCNRDLFVFARFDGNDRLVTAEGSQEERGCV
jgi:hypothetical protein